MIASDALLALLSKVLGARVTQIRPIEYGQIAKAFFFQAQGQDFVVRFTQPNMAIGLHKDLYAYTHFTSPQVPVPPVVCVDEYQGITYAITRKMPGKTLDSFSGEAFEALIPSLIVTLDNIHQIDVRSAAGFGSFDGEGVGLFKSWPDFLRLVSEEEDERWFYGKWHTLFETTFLDRGLFNSIFAEMAALLPFCPAERHLVHADYGFSNVLADSGQITAVLDWANASYGDFLFDVAWLDIGLPGLDFNGRFQHFYHINNRAIPHYHERLRCYHCYIALDSFRFYAKTGQETAYQTMRNRILTILEQS